MYSLFPGDRVASRLIEFDIRIGENWHPSKNPTCSSNQPIESGETRAIFCSRPMRGNNVGIIQKTRNTLNVCEVSVHGRDVQSITGNEPGWLREERCVDICHNLYVTSLTGMSDLLQG